MKLVSPYFDFFVQANVWTFFWEVEEWKNFLYAIIFPQMSLIPV